MSKAVLMSIQPYWGFLIIAKAKGWNIEKYGLYEKTVEVRKREPKDPDWDKTVELYFTKDKKSLARIPEEYRKEVEALCGKVVAEFTCDRIVDIEVLDSGAVRNYWYYELDKSCLSIDEMAKYIGKGKCSYGLHISDLKIYDQQKELSEYKRKLRCCHYPCSKEYQGERNACNFFNENCEQIISVDRPPQSWQYVEEI